MQVFGGGRGQDPNVNLSPTLSGSVRKGQNDPCNDGGQDKACLNCSPNDP